MTGIGLDGNAPIGGGTSMAGAAPSPLTPAGQDLRPSLPEEEWDELVLKIKRKTCIPILGPLACKPRDPATDGIIYPLYDPQALRQLASDIGYRANGANIYFRELVNFASLRSPDHEAALRSGVAELISNFMIQLRPCLKTSERLKLPSSPREQRTEPKPES